MFGEQFFPEIFTNHWNKIGHTFSDPELASMLYSFIRPLEERLAILQKLAEHTKDACLGKAHYSCDGHLLWSSSSEYEAVSRVDLDAHSRFENRYHYIPVPFRRGDVVRITGTKKIGLVSVLMEDDRLLSEAEREKMYRLCDHVDVSVRVDFLEENNRFCHSHIFPLCLEYAQTEETGLRKALLDAAGSLLRGEGSLDYFQDLCLEAHSKHLPR